jgi:hypothetical protein
MKNIIGLFVLFLSFSIHAQDECHLADMPKLEDLKCVTEKGHLYSILPKITEYKGYLFSGYSKCNKPNLDFAQSFQFDYCIGNNEQQMSVEITDLESLFYKSENGKAQKEVILMVFKPEMINPYLQNYKSENKNFDICTVHLPKVTNGKPYVTFEALQNKRFWVHIVIDGDKFKTAKEVDAFINEYTNGFSFPRK